MLEITPPVAMPAPTVITMTAHEFGSCRVAARHGTLRSALPESVPHLSDDQVRTLDELCIGFLLVDGKWVLPDGREFGRSEVSANGNCVKVAAIRGECDFESIPDLLDPHITMTPEGDWECYFRSATLHVALNGLYTTDMDVLSGRALRKNFDPQCLNGRIPKRYQHLTLRTLAPKELRVDGKMGLSLARQQVFIDRSYELWIDDPCCWLILGPTATSKTTLQGVWLADLITFRSTWPYNSTVDGRTLPSACGGSTPVRGWMRWRGGMGHLYRIGCLPTVPCCRLTLPSMLSSFPTLVIAPSFGSRSFRA